MFSSISDDTNTAAIFHSINNNESNEIVPIVEEVEEKLLDKYLGQFKRSLAECVATVDYEWSALEGIARAI